MIALTPRTLTNFPETHRTTTIRIQHVKGADQPSVTSSRRSTGNGARGFRISEETRNQLRKPRRASSPRFTKPQPMAMSLLQSSVGRAAVEPGKPNRDAPTPRGERVAIRRPESAFAAQAPLAGASRNLNRSISVCQHPAVASYDQCLFHN